ncbi:MAG: hypothetical protein H6854_00355 [Rhodospirillales bacterium]|nr:hypothetical protein [Rhodospirillales bacterium]
MLSAKSLVVAFAVGGVVGAMGAASGPAQEETESSALVSLAAAQKATRSFLRNAFNDIKREFPAKELSADLYVTVDPRGNVVATPLIANLKSAPFGPKPEEVEGSISRVHAIRQDVCSALAAAVTASSFTEQASKGWYQNPECDVYGNLTVEFIQNPDGTRGDRHSTTSLSSQQMVALHTGDYADFAPER